MTAPSRQFAHLQAASLARLRARIPADCPLLVREAPAGGFEVRTLDAATWHTGRFQVVAAWIDGFVSAWTRVSRQPRRPAPPSDDTASASERGRRGALAVPPAPITLTE